MAVAAAAVVVVAPSAAVLATNGSVNKSLKNSERLERRDPQTQYIVVDLSG